MLHLFPHMKLFHFFFGPQVISLRSCEWISQEIEHQYGQDRETYYTVCLPSIVLLTHGLMRPNSARHSNGAIMMESVTRIIMCKMLKSSCSRGFHCATPPISCDRHTNAQRRGWKRSSCLIWIWFPPQSGVDLLKEIKLTSEPTLWASLVFCEDEKKNDAHKWRSKQRQMRLEWCEWRKGGENEGWLR